MYKDVLSVYAYRFVLTKEELQYPFKHVHVEESRGINMGNKGIVIHIPPAMKHPGRTLRSRHTFRALQLSTTLENTTLLRPQ
jgi:hypothetical protein